MTSLAANCSILAAKLDDGELRARIDRSSYATKHKLPSMSTVAAREELEATYVACRDYACNSIVNSLTTFDNLRDGEIYDLDCSKDHFFLLARVRTNWESKTIEETAEARKYLGFTVLTEQNLSHFPGRVLYGYWRGIDPAMIAHIYPCDSDTDGYETDPLKLSKFSEMLLDMGDLCESALKMKAYCQVTISSKMPNGSVLMPDAVIAIGEIGPDDRLAAKERGLPILLIHKTPNTVMEVYDAHERAELANPTLI